LWGGATGRGGCGDLHVDPNPAAYAIGCAWYFAFTHSKFRLFLSKVTDGGMVDPAACMHDLIFVARSAVTYFLLAPFHHNVRWTMIQGYT